MTAVGIDVGGTSVKAVLLGNEGAVLREASAPTTPLDADALIRTIADLALELRDDSESAVGVAVAAFLDRTRSDIQFAPNIAWANRPLKAQLEHILGRPVVVENDANAAAFAEYQVGAGREATTLVMFTLGTGVGGAVLAEGELLVGHHGVAGELGHLVVPGGTVECGCGQRGCLETVASGTAIVATVRDRIGSPPATIEEVMVCLDTDAELRDSVLGDVASALAHAISALQVVVDPQVVVFGGGVTERAGPLLLPLIDAELASRASSRHFPVRCELRVAQLGNRAGAIGAALLATSRGDLR